MKKGPGRDSPGPLRSYTRARYCLVAFADSAAADGWFVDAEVEADGWLVDAEAEADG